MLLLLLLLLTSNMLERVFGYIRGFVVNQGGELTQIAQTDNTWNCGLFLHAGAIVEGCAGAAIAVVACIGEVLLVEMLEGRESLEAVPFKYCGPCNEPLTCSKLTVYRQRKRRLRLRLQQSRQARRWHT